MSLRTGTFFTDRWSRFKKGMVVSFFLLCCAIMLGYRATTDSIEAERYLALIVAICFLVVALFFLIVKQKRPEKPEDDKASQAATDLAFKMGMDLTVKEGSVVMVIGSVGSGKSSLIQAILGEMDKVSGEVVWAQNSRVSYCTQQAWLMNATLKENITFVNDLDEERYQRILELVSLRQDLQELPKGDRTEIGERGVNLSGGQKARVSIARAMYNEADIYIFDDVLSALDAHVGKHVFEKCIGDLRARGKTVLMATNQLQVLPRSDLVVFVKHDDATKEGRLGNIGTFDELMHEDDFAELMKEVGISEQDLEWDDPGTPEASANGSAADEKGEGADGKSGGKGGAGGDLVEEEEREEGAVAWAVYWAYVKAARAPLLFMFTIMFSLCGQSVQVLNDMWLTWWTKDALGWSQW